MIIQSAIASFCMTVASNPAYNQACNKAAEAGTKQTGIYQTADSYEGNTINYAKKELTYHLGGQTVGAIGAAGFAYNTTRTKSLNFSLPTLGLCNSINNEITPNSYSIHLKWNLNLK